MTSSTPGFAFGTTGKTAKSKSADKSNAFKFIAPTIVAQEKEESSFLDFDAVKRRFKHQENRAMQMINVYFMINIAIRKWICKCISVK